MNLTQQDIQQLNQFERFLSWKKTWMYNKFIHMVNDIIFLCTGNQCLGGESLIYDPVLKKRERIDSIETDFHVTAWDGEKLVTAKAEKPFKRSIDNLYLIGLSNGASFVASGNHRILLDSGWKQIGECVPGSSVFHPQTTSDIFPSESSQDDQRSNRTIPSSQSDCQGCHYFCDEQLLCLSNNGQYVSPLQDDAPERKEQTFERGDGQECKCDGNHQLPSHHPSNQDALQQTEGHGAEILSHIFCKDRKDTCVSQGTQAFQPSPYESNLLSQYKSSFHQSSIVGDDSYKPPLLFNNSIQVTSISYLREDVKWDFGVPTYHNYKHAGIIHHNCGKTASTAYQYVLRIMGYHPVPKKNLMYFECPKRVAEKLRANEEDDDYVSPHGFYKKTYKLADGTIITLDSWEKGTWSLNDKPKDDKCPYCGDDIVIHYRQKKVFRFCSQTLPGEKETIEGGDGESAEVKNAVYPEFKKWLPPFLIKKDITFRSYAMIIKDPWAGQVLLRDEVYKGSDSVVEFVSYSQSVNAVAGTQKCSVWVDEEPPKDFWDEQLPRLWAEDGDIVLSLTPANNMSWTYDELFERASLYIRTHRICADLSTKNDPLIMAEETEFDLGIGILQASSYDNPTINNSVIEKMMESVDDPDVKLTRIYGVHKQTSGRVFKDFDYRIHVIDENKYFPTGMYRSWRFARMIDYHEKNPWACTFIALNPFNEAFVFEEMMPSPEKSVTFEISNRLAELSGNFKYSIDLIDPLANKSQSNTNTTVTEDINEHFRDFKREDAYPGFQGGYFEGWDTKSTRGRDEVRKRIKWAKNCRVPFNNKVVKDGCTTYVPTLWILNTCKETAKGLKQWRYEEYGDRNSRVNKDANEKTTQKFSHFCMCLEAIFKDRRFKPPVNYIPGRKAPKYFQGRKAS